MTAREGGRWVHAYVPMRLGRGGNDREHPMERHRRAKGEQATAAWTLRHALGRVQLEPPLRVEMTRCSPGRGLDDDNLTGSLKHVRDGIANVLGIDDGDKRVQWVPMQRKADWGVEIAIVEVSNAEG